MTIFPETHIRGSHRLSAECSVVTRWTLKTSRFTIYLDKEILKALRELVFRSHLVSKCKILLSGSMSGYWIELRWLISKLRLSVEEVSERTN